jgi:hypothetical protein
MLLKSCTLLTLIPSELFMLANSAVDAGISHAYVAAIGKLEAKVRNYLTLPSNSGNDGEGAMRKFLIKRQRAIILYYRTGIQNMAARRAARRICTQSLETNPAESGTDGHGTRNSSVKHLQTFFQGSGFHNSRFCFRFQKVSLFPKFITHPMRFLLFLLLPLSTIAQYSDGQSCHFAVATAATETARRPGTGTPSRCTSTKRFERCTQNCALPPATTTDRSGLQAGAHGKVCGLVLFQTQADCDGGKSTTICAPPSGPTA